MLRLFSTKGFKHHAKAARQVLRANSTGAYTRPSPGLYPHQWNRDSGFIAIGYAHYDQKKARRELTSLFAQQWPNGMLPHIVFNPEALGHYFPEPDFWQVPDGRPTSGITMPPLHATACRHIFTVPNYDMTREDFDSRNYWRGPVWININWMVSPGRRPCFSIWSMNITAKTSTASTGSNRTGVIASRR